MPILLWRAIIYKTHARRCAIVFHLPCRLSHASTEFRILLNVIIICIAQTSCWSLALFSSVTRVSDNDNTINSLLQLL